MFNDRARYRITEPLLNLYYAVMRPAWSELESGRGREVWAEASQLISSLVVGPYFKTCAVEYMVEMRAALGLQTNSVGRGVVQQGGSKSRWTSPWRRSPEAGGASFCSGMRNGNGSWASTD